MHIWLYTASSKTAAKGRKRNRKKGLYITHPVTYPPSIVQYFIYYIQKYKTIMYIKFWCAAMHVLLIAYTLGWEFVLNDVLGVCKPNTCYIV